MLLSALAIGISIVLLAWLRKAETLLLSIALGIVIGGAVGNVIDRIYGVMFSTSWIFTLPVIIGPPSTSRIPR